MRFLAMCFVLCVLTSGTSLAAQKDKLVVGTPDGSKVEVKVPRDLQVKQVGPNHYELRRSDPALKKIEIKVTPPPKAKP